MPGNRGKPAWREAAIIAQYLARLRELKPLWNRNFLLLFLPDFCCSSSMVPVACCCRGGRATHNLWLIVPGIALCALASIRGVRLMLKCRHRTVRDRFQSVAMSEGLNPVH